MIQRVILLASLCAIAAASPAAARMSLPSRAEVEEASRPGLPSYLLCVPYARQLTGIQIFGDAHTWWDQAEGRYARGFKPGPVPSWPFARTAIPPWAMSPQSAK